MQGKGKYVFDIGCEQHGEYIPIEQGVSILECKLATSGINH
jgi:hypothetical protein